MHKETTFSRFKNWFRYHTRKTYLNKKIKKFLGEKTPNYKKVDYNYYDKNEREKYLYAFLEANKERFVEMFNYSSKKNVRADVALLEGLYNNSSTKKYNSYLESKLGKDKPIRTFANLFSKNKKMSTKERYVEPTNISSELEGFLKKDKELWFEYENKISKSLPEGETLESFIRKSINKIENKEE